jgi:hypothetical protein
MDAAGDDRPTTLLSRAGGSLRRSPYVWLAATVLLWFVMLRPISLITDGRTADSLILAIGTAVLVVVAGLVAGIVLPRRTYPQMSVEAGPDVVAVVKWAYGVSPFLLSWTAVLAGGQEWCLGLGFLISLGLLTQSARSMAASSD